MTSLRRLARAFGLRVVIPQSVPCEIVGEGRDRGAELRIGGRRIIHQVEHQKTIALREHDSLAVLDDILCHDVAPHGLTMVRPAAAKGLVSRVATMRPFAAAVAAI